ncbi:MAG: glutamine-hydrolyzing GMP synthase [Deltaproteobacteria bacterium]|nr:glutamine-hydrolyzing GMP synthase [Deltaproteobacteria bacterium]
MRKHVLVLDFGSQYTQLIARRIRELGVYSEVRPCTLSPNEVDLRHTQAVILSGGPSSVTDKDAPPFNTSWLDIGLPILGVCYGMQLMAHVCGGRLAQGTSREYGHASVEVCDNSDLFSGFDLDQHVSVWMSHGDHVEVLPQGFSLLATSSGSTPAAIGNPEKRLFAIQFHSEVVHTPRGKEILSNFLFKIAGCTQDWSADDFIGSTVKHIAAMVPPQNNVLCALSGGVDSTVAAVLVHKAIGSRLHCIFVDNGLLRKNEAQQVYKRMKEGLGLNVKLVDASERFLSELNGVSDPEKKRKIIGRVFIEVFDEEAKAIPHVSHLVQGTLYPDVIESVPVRGGPSVTIKSHHNVGGLPDKMKLKLLEPFRELFKDEVRKVGRDLRVPDEVLQRQPFPGPGLAVRVVGEITPQRLHLLREADAIFVEEVKAEGLYEKIWQSFAVLLPVQSVGVMGDGRTYEQTVALRAVASEDGMTADWCYLPQDLLRRVSNRIVREVRGINRVVFDISSKPPATIEWE